jgi:ankyrin repeat protein
MKTTLSKTVTAEAETKKAFEIDLFELRNKLFYVSVVFVVAHNDTEKQKILIPILKNINQLFDGMTLLHIAIKNKHVSTARYLLEQKADPHVLNRAGLTPLASAAQSNQPIMIELLMKHKAVLGYTRALTIAGHEGYIEVIRVLLNHDEQKMSEYLSKHQLDNKMISIDDARWGDEKYNLMLNILFREPAARVLQHRWRANVKDAKWLHKIRLKHPEKKFTVIEGTIKSKLPMRFISEPWGTKAHEHAKQIQAGQWLELDFKDREFERNIYKSLRQGEISADQMVTADLLYHAKKFFRNNLRKYSFDEKGPYDPASIDYATEAKLALFREALKKLPQHDRNYFSINCGRQYEYIFLYNCVNRNEDAARLPQTRTFLEKFVNMLNVSLAEKRKLYADIDNLLDENISIVRKAQENLYRALRKKYPEVRHPYTSDYAGTVPLNYRSQEIESPMLAVALFAPDRQEPFIEISPDYDKRNPYAPLLCRIILHTSAWKVLQEAMHGKEHTTDPFYVVGQISTRLIRGLDEKPEEYGLTRQARPIGLIHPDVPNEETLHDAYVDSCTAIMHDFSHAWQNGALPFKPMVRYLRQLFDTTGYDMSKNIWRLSDMDFSLSHEIQVAIKKNGIWDQSEMFARFIDWLFKQKFFISTDQHDTHLLLIMDMILNKETWKTWIGSYPEEIKLSQEKIGLPCLKNFNKTIQDMKKVIDTHQGKNPKNLNLFYILAYRMRHTPEGVSALNQLIATGHDLNTYFKWSRNQGILHGERTIENMAPEEIARACCRIVEKTEKEKLSVKALRGLSVLASQPVEIKMIQSKGKFLSDIKNSIHKIKKRFKEQFKRLWDDDRSAILTESGLIIEIKSNLPALYFDDIKQLISELQKMGIIAKDFNALPTAKRNGNSPILFVEIPLSAILYMPIIQDEETPIRNFRS